MDDHRDTAESPVRVGIALVRRRGSFLVRRRPEGAALAGFWEFPGGKCEPGETPEEATRRECLEEFGTGVVVERLRRRVTHRYDHALVELSFFDCATEREDAEPDPGSGFRWVPTEALPSLAFPEANATILDEIVRGHRGP